MNEAEREQCIAHVATKAMGTGRHSEFIREPLLTYLRQMDDRTLRAVAVLTNLIPSSKSYSDEISAVRSLILGGEDTDHRDIRTFANHIQELENRDITLQDLILLLSTLRYLELVDEEGEEYPYLASHVKLMRYQYRDDLPYHHNDELVKLVHDNHERHEEIVNLMYRESIKDVGLIGEHLRNKAPALKDGIL